VTDTWAKSMQQYLTLLSAVLCEKNYNRSGYVTADLDLVTTMLAFGYTFGF